MVYQILTPNGFKPFKSIKKTTSNLVTTATFIDGTIVTGSPNHSLIIDDVEINLCNIPTEIASVETHATPTDLYTVQGVEGECYLINGNIISKNCAFIPEKIFDEFYSSTYPTISSGKETKIIITSSAKDINHFYELWKDANDGLNTYAPMEVRWQDVPGRDEEWKKRTIKDIGQRRFDREFANKFTGRTSVVIPLPILKSLKVINPLVENDDIKIFEYAQPNETYLAYVDVAEGNKGDNSAIIIIKVPKSVFDPYRIVFTYKSNVVPISHFTEVVYSICTKYNEAILLPEVNIHDIATVLYRDFEYENIVKTTVKKQSIATAFMHEPTKFGIKTTTPVKSTGLELLIEIFEEEKLFISDINILKELSNLVKNKNSFEAKSGHTDDFVSCLILFAWAMNQAGMKELLDLETNITNKLKQDYINQLKDELPNFFTEGYSY